MEGTVIRSQFGFSGRSAALASSRTTHRSRQVTTVELLQKAQITPDYLPSLFSTGLFVDSPLDSFSPGRPTAAGVTILGTEVPPPPPRPMLICFTFFKLVSSHL